MVIGIMGYGQPDLLQLRLEGVNKRMRYQKMFKGKVINRFMVGLKEH